MELIKDTDTRKIGEKGRALFGRISPELEKDYRGKFVVIEVDSEEYFVGDTIAEANQKARAKYPGTVFFLGRIGYRAATSFHGRR